MKKNRHNTTLALNVYQYILENPHQHITTQALAKKFCTSQTTLKTAFRTAYGIPIQTFIRKHKMLEAAYLLRQTEHRIIDIAGQFGYSNASKFSCAFQRVIGETPKEYRNRYSKH